MLWSCNKMKKYIVLLALIGALLPRAAMPQFLHAVGKEIRDGSNQPVLLRGVGLGGWLMPEGYMLHIPGYGSPTTIREGILDLLGPADTETFYELYRQNYVNEKDIALIARWGFNSIRLPFHYEILTPKDQPGAYLEEGFAFLDSTLAWCERNQLYLILDMHAAPGGQNPNNISDSDGEAKLWTQPANQDRTVEIWKTIAARYADKVWIGGYDLINEPVLPDGYSNLDLRNLYMRIASAIREVDNNHMLFLEGNWFATDFADLTPPILYGSNVAYSFHKYWNSTAQSSIQYLLNLRANWNVPLWLGESGENSNQWFYETVQLMEAQDIGWNWWTHKKIATLTSPLSSPISPDYQTVLDYWNGSASRPSQAFAKNALFEMAQNLALERCEFRPDVLEALFDPEFGTKNKPFVDHILPGFIDCSDFDLGTEGVAYSDARSMRDSFDNGDPWNNGWQYRNDGVDLEKSQDSRGAPYSIGWIDAGEWLKYTVTVTETGIYDVAFRVASLSGGGRLHLFVDGNDALGEIVVPQTGGWYNWQWLNKQGLTLSEGQHVIELRMTASGFNLNQLSFVFKTGTDVQEEKTVPQQFGLEQNYPNPFNPSTVIKYQVPETGPVRLAIYNVTGELLRVLIDARQAKGSQSIVWDGRTRVGALAPAGLYYYHLTFNELKDVKKMVLLR